MHICSQYTTRRHFIRSSVEGLVGFGVLRGRLAFADGTDSKQIIDLVKADEKHQRTGEADIIELGNGELLMVYSDYSNWRDDASAVLRSCRSSNGGASWSEPILLVANEGKKNVATVSFIRLSSTDILLFYTTQHSGEESLLTYRRSTDDGKTFGNPSYCATDHRYRNFCNDCVIRLESGRIMAPFTVKAKITEPGANRNYQSGFAYSEDEGINWKLSNEVFLPKGQPMEPKVVQLKDGRLWALMRTDQGYLGQSFSQDNGASWARGSLSKIKAPQSPIMFERIPTTGDLMLIRNPQVDLKHHHQGRRTPLRCTISRDEGKTWKHTVDLESDRSWAWSYGSCTFVDEMAIFTYYMERFDRPWHTLRVTRVPVSWLYG